MNECTVAQTDDHQHCLIDIYCGRYTPCVGSGGVVLLLVLWAGGTKIEVFRFRGEELSR